MVTNISGAGFIKPNQTGATTATVGAKGTFSSVTKNAHLSSKAMGNAQNSPAISREQLMSLAQEVKSGALTKEEASEKFIMQVADNSLNNKLSEKDKETLISTISGLFSDDPQFSERLEKNLKALT